MLNQQSFEDKHGAEWRELREMLKAMQSRRASRSGSDQFAEFPDLYSSACHHLSVAQARGYSPQLIDTLNTLVVDSYNRLYRYRSTRLRSVMRFLTAGFPQLVRQHSRYFWLCAALLYLPGIITGLICYFDGNFIYRIHSAESVSSFEFMYEPGNNFRPVEYESASSFRMFGHYIQNNIGIDFKCLAGGIVFGIGTVLILIFNGLSIGSIAGHLTAQGYVETFWGFVAGHSAFELTAAVISGMSGLLIGHALINPGSLSRAEALQKNAMIAVRLVVGAGIMTLAAAFIEAYWSSMTLRPSIKYSVGVGFWLLTCCYLLFAGRKQ